MHEAGDEVRAGKRTNNGCGNNGVEEWMAFKKQQVRKVSGY
jgi:hypothetical protein